MASHTTGDDSCIPVFKAGTVIFLMMAFDLKTNEALPQQFVVHSHLVMGASNSRKISQ